MSVRIGRYTFRYVTYDPSSDVLDAALEGPRPGRREVTPEEHVWRFDERDRFVGISVRDARRQLEREGALYVTLPTGERERVSGADTIISRA